MPARTRHLRGGARVPSRRGFPGLIRRLRAAPWPAHCRAGLATATALLAGAVLTVLSPAAAWASTQAATTAEAPVHAHLLAHRASAPAYCQHGGPQLWAHLTACGWPGPASTGPKLSRCPRQRLVPAGTGLGRAIVIRKPDAVISCQQMRGMLKIEARNVTVRNSTIASDSGARGLAANGTAAIYVAEGASAVINNVTINGNDGVHACIWHQGVKLTVHAVNCSGADDGVFSWADTGYSWTTGDNFTIRDSYFHGFTHATANGHEDGYQTEGARHGLITHNTYRMNASADSAIAIWDARRTASDITVTGNLITGGGFAVYAEDQNPGDGTNGSPQPGGGFSVTGVQFASNVFSTAASGCVGQWGVWFTRPAWQPYKGGPTDGWHRHGNTVLETGENIDAQNPHNAGSRCR
jgi:Right handed beta helix region